MGTNLLGYEDRTPMGTKEPTVLSTCARLEALYQKGGAMSTTGWIILIIVLLVVFGGGFGWSRRGR